MYVTMYVYAIKGLDKLIPCGWSWQTSHSQLPSWSNTIQFSISLFVVGLGKLLPCGRFLPVELVVFSVKLSTFMIFIGLVEGLVLG